LAKGGLPILTEKAALVRLGIRGFNPKLRRAAGRLDDLRTLEGEPIPPNTLAELRRDMERRRLISNQIRHIEETRLRHFDRPWLRYYKITKLENLYGNKQHSIAKR